MSPCEGHEDDRDARVDLADRPVDLQAGLAGQAQVEEDYDRRLCVDKPEPSRARACHVDPVRRARERHAHLLRDQRRVIIDEQDVGHEDPTG
jgi:hypothetical protein